MGRSHNAIGSYSASTQLVTRCLTILIMLAIACTVILLTPHRLRADDNVALAGTAANNTIPGAVTAAASKSPWDKALLTADNPSNSPSRATKAVLYILGIMLLGGGLYKRFSAKRSSNGLADIEVISRKAVSPKHALLIVNVEGERLLLAQGAETLTLVTKLTNVKFRDELAQIMDQDLGLDVNEPSDIGLLKRVSNN